MTVDHLLIVGAFVCFAVSALTVVTARINLQSLGLALATLTWLV